MNTVFRCNTCKRNICGTTQSWNIHCAGKKHIALSPRKITLKGSFDVEKVDELHAYMLQFGELASYKVDVDAGKVSVDYFFVEKKSYTAFIGKTHKFLNEELEVTSGEPKQDPPTPVNPVNSAAPLMAQPTQNKAVKVKMNNAGTEASKLSEVVKSLRGGKTFAEQVDLLLSKLQVDKTAAQNNRKIIYNDLTAAIGSMFFLNKIYFFGSSVTGLDIQGSDLDVYIANVRQKNKGEVVTLKTIRMLIYRCRKFCDVLLISGASVPIIKCIHTKTQICCDLNVRNKLSVNNSELIKYYLSLDEKLGPLMITIKFWADYCSLKKVNFFSGYALCLMVIFYLQQEPFKVPSVLELQKNTPPDVVDGWNCAFSPCDYDHQVLENQSLLQLTCGFFKYYSSFDYVSQVICPYLGTPVQKISFIKPFSLPPCYDAYMSQNQMLGVNATICIQDPFEHGKNVASSVPLNCVGKLIILCKVAADVISQGEPDLLYKLLTRCSANPLNVNCFHIEKDVDDDDQQWIHMIKNLITKVLKEVLNCQIKELPTNNTCNVTYECTSQFSIWDNRVSVLKNLLIELPPNINDLDKEIATTSWILKHFPQTLTTKMFVRVTFQRNPCKVEIMSRSTNKSKCFAHVSQFFRVKLLHFLSMDKKSSSNISVPEDGSGINTMIKTDDKIINQSNLSDTKLRDKQVSDVSAPSAPILQRDSKADLVIIDSDNVKTNEYSGNGSEERPKSEEDGELFEEEEDEDVPADFFDDFSNQDFMDGLDIVDAWDGESKPQQEGVDLGNNRKTERSERKVHSPIKCINTKSAEGRPMKKYVRSRSPIRRRKRSTSNGRRPRSRSKSRSRDRNRNSDVRRDPEKTRRDISKDKVKCAKDKEQKLVTDKLRIVETGLVPPGTEMDVDISSLMNEKSNPSTGNIDKSRERERRYPRRSTSREPRKHPTRYSRSPVYRSRDRGRLEPASGSRYRLPSIDSGVSDREARMRSSRKRSRSRESPSRSKQRKYEEKKKKKQKSFLEEIRDKLNEVRPAPVIQYTHPPPNLRTFNSATPQPMPTPVPAPAPVPTPNQFFSQSNPSMQQQYDQRFFIGEAYPMGPPNMIMNQPQSLGFNLMQLPPMQPPAPVAQVSPMPPSLSPASIAQRGTLFSHKMPAKFPAQNTNVNKPAPATDKAATDKIDKLFADKKISLSDFLTITAKSEVQSSSPEHLQKKIYVISRCQDAIKAMTDERKYTGRLVVKPSSDSKAKSEVKFQSPLRRIPIVRFQFTSPAKNSEEVDSFAGALDKILKKVGVLKDSIDLEDSEEKVSKVANSSFADEDTSVLALKASHLGSSKKTICEECKKRKSKTFVEVGSQCVNAKETISIGVQVSEEDLTPTKGMFKNDSIAYFTPAQLLEKEMEKESPSASTISEKQIERNKEDVSETVITTKKEKPKAVFKPKAGFKAKPGFKPKAGFKNRGNFRSSFREREYDVNVEEIDFYERDRSSFEDPRENLTHRYGPAGPRYSRMFIDEGHPGMSGSHLRDEDPMFTNFTPPAYRGRDPNGFEPSRY